MRFSGCEYRLAILNIIKRKSVTRNNITIKKFPKENLLIIAYLQVLIVATAITFLAAGTAAWPEPPVSSYLPPNQLYGPPQNPGIPTGLGGPIASPANSGINQYLPPNQQYGPPGAGGGINGGYGDGSNVSSQKQNYKYNTQFHSKFTRISIF